MLASLLISLTVQEVRAQPERLNIYSAAAAPTLALDPNGFLKNPRWYRNGAQVDLPNIEAQCRFRVATGHLDRRSLVVTTPNCLSENERRIVTLDEASPTLGLGAVCVTGGKTGNVRGHVNWFPVTVTGQIHWNSFASGIQDHDVNFDLIPQTDHALTTGNSALPSHGGRRAYHIESYFEETFDRIGATGGEFWPEVKSDITDPAAARDLIDDRFAIVTGLYGLDAVHGFQAELHPAFMMSILLDASRVADRAHEQWAVMVRNMGSEGDCAGGTHALTTADTTAHTQRLIIDLGLAPIAAGQPGGLPRVVLGPNWVSDLGFRPAARVATDGRDGRKHLYLDFVHPRPVLGELDFLFLGQVSIEWSGVGAPAWQERVDAWQPRDASTPPKLGAIQYKSAPARLRASAELIEQTKYRKGIPGETVLRQDRRNLHHFTDDVELSVGESPTPPVTAQVQSSASWPIAEAVRFGCTSGIETDPICRSNKRWTVGVGYSPDYRGSAVKPFASLYYFPHSFYLDREDLIGTILNYASVLGYRFDAQLEEFTPYSAQDSVTVFHPARRGVSFRVAPFISPNTVRISSGFSFMPYEIANVGVSWLTEGKSKVGWTAGWGLGMQFLVENHDFLLEVQNMSRQGAYSSHWVVSAAMLWPLGR